MRIRSICLVKNEADIIEETLTAACAWSDVIYVIDNASTDGTWEKLQRLAAEHEPIVLFERTDEFFGNALRRRPFVKQAPDCREGDWWAKLDADEIYIDDPREFLARVPERYQNVRAAVFQYYFTDRDLAHYEAEPERYDDGVPVADKCRYYLNNSSEARFFRFDRKLRWDDDKGWPYVGATYPRRIRMKHYQFRSPMQIQKRIELRRRICAGKPRNFRHEAPDREAWLQMQFGRVPGFAEFVAANHAEAGSPGEAWRDRVVPAALLDYDAHDGHYELREDLMPPMHWAPRHLGCALVNRFRFLRRYLVRSAP